MNRCEICGKGLSLPRKCIICESVFCDNHVEKFRFPEQKSESLQNDSTVYICIKCLQYIRGMKSKPEHLWSDEEKIKTKGMAGKVVKMLGAAGVALVVAIFFFALWLFKKAAKLGGKEMGDSGYEIEGHSFGQGEAEEFRTRFMEENPTFEEEPVFKDDEPLIADEQLPFVEEKFPSESNQEASFAK